MVTLEKPTITASAATETPDSTDVTEPPHDDGGLDAHRTRLDESIRTCAEQHASILDELVRLSRLIVAEHELGATTAVSELAQLERAANRARALAEADGVPYSSLIESQALVRGAISSLAGVLSTLWPAHRSHYFAALGPIRSPVEEVCAALRRTQSDVQQRFREHSGGGPSGGPTKRSRTPLSDPPTTTFPGGEGDTVIGNQDRGPGAPPVPDGFKQRGGLREEAVDDDLLEASLKEIGEVDPNFIVEVRDLLRGNRAGLDEPAEYDVVTGHYRQNEYAKAARLARAARKYLERRYPTVEDELKP